MSYLSELVHRRITVAQALGKSVGYIKARVGLIPSDAQVDDVAAAAEKAASQAASVASMAFANYIRTHAPMLPADVIATGAANLALQFIDGAIAGAANVVKAHN